MELNWPIGINYRVFGFIIFFDHLSKVFVGDHKVSFGHIQKVVSTEAPYRTILLSTAMHGVKSDLTHPISDAQTWPCPSNFCPPGLRKILGFNFLHSYLWGYLIGYKSQTVSTLTYGAKSPHCHALEILGFIISYFTWTALFRKNKSQKSFETWRPRIRPFDSEWLTDSKKQLRNIWIVLEKEIESKEGKGFDTLWIPI